MKKSVATGVTTVIVLLAMAGGAYASPLSAEQQAEIVALKARLSALEQQVEMQSIKQKKAEESTKKSKDSALKFYGDVRVRAVDQGDGYKFEQRVRLNFEKQINQDAFFRMRAIAMNENELGATGTKDNYHKIDNAYMQFYNLYGDKNTSLKLGRFGHSFGTTGYWSSAGSLGMYDGIEVTTGNVVKVSAGYGDWGGAKDSASTDAKQTTLNKLEENIFLKVGYKPSRATALQGWHIRETSSDASPKNYEVTGLGFKSSIGRHLTLAGDYSRNAATGDKPVGTFFTMAYGNARMDKPHSYEGRLYYANVDKGNVPGVLNKSINIPCNDVEGLGVSLHYVVVQNVLAEFLTGFHMKQKSTGKEKDNYYRFQVSARF